MKDLVACDIVMCIRLPETWLLGGELELLGRNSQEGSLKSIKGEDSRIGVLSGARAIGFSGLMCFPLEEHKRISAVPFCQLSDKCTLSNMSLSVSLTGMSATLKT